jgi:hypothetical protein
MHSACGAVSHFDAAVRPLAWWWKGGGGRLLMTVESGSNLILSGGLEEAPRPAARSKGGFVSLVASDAPPAAAHHAHHPATTLPRISMPPHRPRDKPLTPRAFSNSPTPTPINHWKASILISFCSDCRERKFPTFGRDGGDPPLNSMWLWQDLHGKNRYGRIWSVFFVCRLTCGVQRAIQGRPSTTVLVPLARFTP